MKCLICEKKLEGTLYSYKISGKEVNFCEQCEMVLCAEMMAQLVTEVKFRMDIPYVDKRMMTKKELLKR